MAEETVRKLQQGVEIVRINITVFLDETPLWVVVPLGLIYVAVGGYFVYVIIRLFKEK